MKVRKVQLKNFKRFKEASFDFTDEETGLARDLILITGRNGSGKTSLLQAIAATLGQATKRLESIADLDWPGFDFDLVSLNWGTPIPDVKIETEFSSDELFHTYDFFQRVFWETEKPGLSPFVSLSWRDGQVVAGTEAEIVQFHGRDFARKLVREDGFEVFHSVGSVFWYTDQRTATSLTGEEESNGLELTTDKLRDLLSKWQLFHQNVDSGRVAPRPYFRDLYGKFQKLFETVFPGRTMVGPAPRPGIDEILSEPLFFLSDGTNQYEISEMSGGERALFPILLDFVNWNIHNSVILIDELELHLHPPMQQALLRILPKLGQNNQFIVTTHSDSIARLVPEAHIIRL